MKSEIIQRLITPGVHPLFNLIQHFGDLFRAVLIDSTYHLNAGGAGQYHFNDIVSCKNR